MILEIALGIAVAVVIFWLLPYFFWGTVFCGSMVFLGVCKALGWVFRLISLWIAPLANIVFVVIAFPTIIGILSLIPDSAYMSPWYLPGLLLTVGVLWFSFIKTFEFFLDRKEGKKWIKEISQ